MTEPAETGEAVVHYEGAFYDCALCGDALEMDDHAAISEPVETTKRVTCENCIAIVRHVRGI
jgi:DNA-directed RNA polymerase subunit RPC12/RpoP